MSTPNLRRAGIKGVGIYVPPDVLTNEDLTEIVDTSDEWITQRTGIKKRHILKGKRGSAFMGTRAVRHLLGKYHIDPSSIDLIICATVTPEFIFPATANIIAAEVGALNAWGFDLEAACSSFLYALAVGSQFIETGRYQRVVVVGVDKMSAIMNYQDRTTCVLFGDAAGAILLEPVTDGTGLIDFVLYSDGRGCVHLHQKAGGSRLIPSIKTVRNNLHFVYQEGKQVFKYAVQGMAQAVQTIMERNQLQPDDIHFLIPHQANRRIIESTANYINLPMEKVVVNIHEYGNTTSATIPLCLAECEPELRHGSNIILATFGGGFTWGGAYLKWSYNS